MNLSDYTKESVEKLQKVIQNIKNKLKDEVDLATYRKLAKELQTVFDGLQKKAEVNIVQPEKPSEEMNVPKLGDNKEWGHWGILMTFAIASVVFIHRKKSLTK